MHLVGPVFFKELITLSRRRRHFAVRALFLGAIVLGVWLTARSAWLAMSYRGSFLDYAAQIGWPVFRTVMALQFWAIVLIVPALVAAVVAGEKEHDTFGLLLLTQQSLARVLVDKLLSRLAYVGLLLLAGVPLVLGLLKFGGVDSEAVATIYLALLGTVAYAAGIGLLCSVWAHTVSGAVLLAFIVLSLAHISLGVIAGLLVQAVGPAADPLMFISPSAVLGSLLWQQQQWYGQWWPWSVSSIDACLISIVSSWLFLTAAVCISWWLLPHRLSHRPQSFLKQLFVALDRRCRQLRGIWGREVLRDRPLGRHPVWWRETSKRFAASNGFLIRSGYVLLGLGILLMLCLLEPPYAMPVTPLAIWIGFVLVVAVVTSARAFAAEKEAHTFPLLLSTPVAARAIYLGKLAGIVKSLSVILLVPFGLTLVQVPWRMWLDYQPGSYWEVERDDRSLVLFGVLVLPLLGHVIITGLNASLCRRRTLTALLQTVLSLTAQCVFFYLVVTITLAFGDPATDAWDMLAFFQSIVAEPPSIGEIIGEVFSPLHAVENEGMIVPAVMLLTFFLVLLPARVYLAISSFDRVVGRL